MSYVLLFGTPEQFADISEIVFATKEDAEEHLETLNQNLEICWSDIRRVVVV